MWIINTLLILKNNYADVSIIYKIFKFKLYLDDMFSHFVTTFICNQTFYLASNFTRIHVLVPSYLSELCTISEESDRRVN